MARAKRYGVPTASTSARVARTLLALHVAGARGILVRDLIDRVGTSRATLYRVLALLRSVGWRLESMPESERGVIRLRLAAWQRLPRQQQLAPLLNPARPVKTRATGAVVAR